MRARNGKSWLSTDQITAVKSGPAIINMVKARPDVLSKITPRQIATIKDPWWMGQMPKPLLQSMSHAQVDGIPASVYPKIKERLSATQQAWRS